jgi:hypothetical protein
MNKFFKSSLVAALATLSVSAWGEVYEHVNVTNNDSKTDCVKLEDVDGHTLKDDVDGHMLGDGVCIPAGTQKQEIWYRDDGMNPGWVNTVLYLEDDNGTDYKSDACKMTYSIYGVVGHWCAVNWASCGRDDRYRKNEAVTPGTAPASASNLTCSTDGNFGFAQDGILPSDYVVTFTITGDSDCAAGGSCSTKTSK